MLSYYIVRRVIYMQSRMDRYRDIEDKKFERSKKNTKLYEDVYDDMYRDTNYQNMKVIDTAKEINIDKLKNILDDNYDTRQYRTLRNYDIGDTDSLKKSSISRNEKRSYDINEIISEAKNRRTFMEEAKEKQKYIDFKNAIEGNYDTKYEESKEEEKKLENLINTVSISNENKEESSSFDILSDLKGSDNTIVTNPVEASFDSLDNVSVLTETKNLEKTLVKADKTFYTDSNMFTKNDFEDFSTLSRSLGKKRGAKKLIIIIIILVLLAVLLYFGITKFGMEKYLNKIIDIFKKK